MAVCGSLWTTIGNNGQQWTTIRVSTCICDAAFRSLSSIRRWCVDVERSATWGGGAGGIRPAWPHRPPYLIPYLLSSYIFVNPYILGRRSNFWTWVKYTWGPNNDVFLADVRRLQCFWGPLTWNASAENLVQTHGIRFSTSPLDVWPCSEDSETSYSTR